MKEELKSYLCNIKYEIETSDIELEKLDLGLNAIMWNQLIDCLINLQEEIERLNNIINTLEEELEENLNYEEYDRVEKDTFIKVIKRIEELKGE